MNITSYCFENMISVAHLFHCWEVFRKGKRKKKDVQAFERHLEDEIFSLHTELKTMQYKHGPYQQFYVHDPKRRHISKASVRDRLVHQMIYHFLYQVFDSTFIFHSFSSRSGKGTHLGIEHLSKMIRKVSHNGKRACYALKVDIYRFFDHIDHQILKELLKKKVSDQRVLMTIEAIIDSFENPKTLKGIPLGNVTSQLFANMYLHVFDQFVKEKLKEKYYLRFCDDFIFLSSDLHHLHLLLPFVKDFLRQELHLELHPCKVLITSLQQGIDFLGYLLFSHHRLLRVSTKNRMKKKLKRAYTLYMKGQIKPSSMDQRLQSYLGILSHANQFELAQALKNAYWIRTGDFGEC